MSACAFDSLASQTLSGLRDYALETQIAFLPFVVLGVAGTNYVKCHSTGASVIRPISWKGGGGGGGGFSKKVWLSLAVPMLIVLFRDLVKQGILT